MLVLVFVVSLPAVTARLYASDEVHYFSYLRSLYFDRDVSFENEYRYFYEHNIAQSPGYHETFLERSTATGRRVNYGTMGAAILWSPFYAAADVLTRMQGTHEANGFTQPYISAVAYGSAFYAFLAVLLSIRAARLILGRGTAWAGVAVWIGTPLLFYMYVAPPFSHAVSAFAVALFVNVWLHVRNTWSTVGAFALGLCAALLATVREQDVFVAIGPIADFAYSVARPPRLTLPHFARAALAGLAGTAIGYTPQLLAYTALNGYAGPAEHVARKMYWYAPHGLKVLASPHHGFLFWTPLALLAIVGLIAMASGRLKPAPTGVSATGRLKPAPTGSDAAGGTSVEAGFSRPAADASVEAGLSRPAAAASVEAGLSRPAADASVEAGFSRPDIQRLGICLLLMVASQVYVAGSVDSWSVAGAFGQRRFVCLTVVLTIGLAALWRTANRRILTVAVAVCVWWNLALMAQFATRLMDRQRLEPARNAYHAFVTLPLTAPSLAYRYVTNRASFYQPQPAQNR